MQRVLLVRATVAAAEPVGALAVAILALRAEPAVVVRAAEVRRLDAGRFRVVLKRPALEWVILRRSPVNANRGASTDMWWRTCEHGKIWAFVAPRVGEALGLGPGRAGHRRGAVTRAVAERLQQHRSVVHVDPEAGLREDRRHDLARLDVPRPPRAEARDVRPIAEAERGSAGARRAVQRLPAGAGALEMRGAEHAGGLDHQAVVVAGCRVAARLLLCHPRPSGAGLGGRLQLRRRGPAPRALHAARADGGCAAFALAGVRDVLARLLRPVQIAAVGEDRLARAGVGQRRHVGAARGVGLRRPDHVRRGILAARLILARRALAVELDGGALLRRRGDAGLVDVGHGAGYGRHRRHVGAALRRLALPAAAGPAERHVDAAVHRGSGAALRRPRHGHAPAGGLPRALDQRAARIRGAAGERQHPQALRLVRAPLAAVAAIALARGRRLLRGAPRHLLHRRAEEARAADAAALGRIRARDVLALVEPAARARARRGQQQKYPQAELHDEASRMRRVFPWSGCKFSLRPR